MRIAYVGVDGVDSDKRILIGVDILLLRLDVLDVFG